MNVDHPSGGTLISDGRVITFDVGGFFFLVLLYHVSPLGRDRFGCSRRRLGLVLTWPGPCYLTVIPFFFSLLFSFIIVTISGLWNICFGYAFLSVFLLSDILSSVPPRLIPPFFCPCFFSNTFSLCPLGAPLPCPCVFLLFPLCGFVIFFVLFDARVWPFHHPVMESCSWLLYLHSVLVPFTLGFLVA